MVMIMSAPVADGYWGDEAEGTQRALSYRMSARNVRNGSVADFIEMWGELSMRTKELKTPSPGGRARSCSFLLSAYQCYLI